MSDIESKLKELRKKLGSVSYESDKFESCEYIDTGSYALNRIVSGDFNRGVPNNRVMIIAGESSVGKSLFATLIAINALNKNKFDKIFIFDSEGGISRQMFINSGVDLSKIEYVPLNTVEDAATKILATYDIIAEIQKDSTFRAFGILDSLGALVTRKTGKDIADDNQKLDRGLRARLINDLVKSLTMPVLTTKCGIIILNHVYDDPNAMYPSKIKNQSGGKGIQFMNRLCIQCTKSFSKDENRDTSGQVYRGNKLKFMAIKNFIVIPFVESEVELDFKNGFTSKYTGLIEVALKYGFITQPSKGWYSVPTFEDGKKIREAALLYDGAETDKIWATFIDKLNDVQRNDMQFGNFANPPGKIVINEVPEERIEQLEGITLV